MRALGYTKSSGNSSIQHSAVILQPSLRYKPITLRNTCCNHYVIIEDKLSTTTGNTKKITCIQEICDVWNKTRCKDLETCKHAKQNNTKIKKAKWYACGSKLTSRPRWCAFVLLCVIRRIMISFKAKWFLLLYTVYLGVCSVVFWNHRSQSGLRARDVVGSFNNYYTC